MKYSLILAVPPYVRTATAGMSGAIVVDIVQERLGDHLHLVALDSGPARSEACLVQVSNWLRGDATNPPTK